MGMSFAPFGASKAASGGVSDAIPARHLALTRCYIMKKLKGMENET